MNMHFVFNFGMDIKIIVLVSILNIKVMGLL